MKKRFTAVLTAILLSVLSLCMVASAGYAQKSQNSMQKRGGTKAPMLMHKMTSQQRWAAAVNHANRRAANIRVQQAKGVK